MPSAFRKKFMRTDTNPQEGSSQSTLDGDVPTASHDMHDLKGPSESVEQQPKSEDFAPNENAQEGVTNAEAITLTWTKKSLGFAYVLMWCLYLVNAFQSQITSNASAYITSDFAAHSLLTIIPTVSSVMGAATYMPLAKVLNLWDRSVGFAIMVGFATLGLILSATCNDIGTYAAAEIFYSIGFAGLIFCIDVITLDTSTLRDRGLAYAFTSSPYIITAYAGPAAAEKFVQGNWRWGYGMFAIILPVVATPMYLLLRYNRNLAKKNGTLREKEPSGRTTIQSIIHYLIEFDIFGTFLLTAGLALFLLPFTLASSAAEAWKTPHIIVMLVIGVLCLISFSLFERYGARVPFLPWEILISRTVAGAVLIDATYQISYYCWDDYYTSYLQVVFYQSVSTAGYIANIFDVVSGVWLFAVGLMIRYSRRFQWQLFWAVPLYILGSGLMIYFRNPDSNIGYMIMCQIFIAFAGGTMIITQQVAVLAASDHNNAASALAFLNTFGNMGGAVGSSISGGIWTNTFGQALQKYLPADVVGDWETIYDDIYTQLSYEKGSPARDAIIQAYTVAQRYMLIAGTSIMCLSLIWMFIMKDIKLTKTQSKGVLF